MTEKPELTETKKKTIKKSDVAAALRSKKEKMTKLGALKGMKKG